MNVRTKKSTANVGTRRRVVPFEIKAGGDDGSMIFEGYAACTRNIDSYGEIIAPGAFAMDLPRFLADGFIGGLNHNWDDPIGVPLSASEDEKGLLSKASVLDTEHGRDVMKMMRPGPNGERPVVKKLSIGFRSLGREYLENSDDVTQWWASIGYTPTADDLAAAKYGATILTRVRLYEFSPVTLPANTLCDVTDVKGDAPGRLTLDDHLLSALGSVEQVCGRLTSYAKLKRESGRPIPPSRRATLKRMQDFLITALADTAELPDETETLRLQSEILELEASLLAVS